MKITIRNVINILNNIDKYLKNKFYDKCIDYLKKLDINIDNEINKIDDNKYCNESIRLFLLNNLDKYDFYYSTEKITNEANIIICRNIKLGRNGLTNFLKQLYALETNNINNLCVEPKVNIVNDGEIIFYVFEHGHNIDNKMLNKIINKKQCLNLFLGIETIQVIKHQNITRFCKYVFTTNHTIKQKTKMFERFFNFMNDLDDDVKKRMVIVSGSILHSLGTTYTNDIDIIYYAHDYETNSEYVQKIKKKFNNPDMDCYIITKNTVIQANENDKPRNYIFKWLLFSWPSLVGKSHILEVMTDPKYHFYFMGIRMFGIKMTVERLLLRASPAAFVDLLMLDKINNIKSKPCFPNLLLRSGKITIYDDDMINRKLHTTSKYFKNWHGINMPVPKLKNIIRKCSDDMNYKYSKQLDKNIYSTKLIDFNNYLLINYINMFKNDINNNLLSFGVNIEFLNNIINQNNIVKHFSFIESSKDLIQDAQNIIKDNNSNINIQFIDKNDIFSKSYQIILFNLSINRYLSNIDNLINNIKNIKNNKTVIITYLNKDKVLDKLAKHNNRYEIYINDDPFYGIYKLDKENDLQKVMIYSKGIYGLETGSIEYLIDIDNIINKFKNIGYEMALNSAYSQYNEKDLYNILDPKLKNIVDLYQIIVFNKKNLKQDNLSHDDIKIHNYDFQYQYFKYKKKYLNLLK